MFYEKYVKLCNSVGKSPSAVALEIGIYKSTVSNWKNRGTSPTDATAQKVADYFHITLEELMQDTEKAPTTQDERHTDKEYIKFALFGGGGEITDAMYEEVKRFARMVRMREEAEKKGD